MPKKEYYKPNRTNSRYFKPCDIARCAWNCVEDTDSTIEEVFLCVAKRFQMEAIALPTSDREIPENVEEIIAKVQLFAEKAKSISIRLEDVLDQVDIRLSKKLENIPVFLIDDVKTDEDKFFAKALSLLRASVQKAASSLLIVFNLAKDIRDTAREFSNNIAEFVLALQKAQEIIEAGKDISKLKILTLANLKNCECKFKIEGHGTIETGYENVLANVSYTIIGDKIYTAKVDSWYYKGQKYHFPYQQKVPEIVIEAFFATFDDSDFSYYITQAGAGSAIFTPY